MEVNGTEEKGGRVPSPVKGLLSHVQMSIYSFWQNGQLILARFCRRAMGVWEWITEGILRICMGRGGKAPSQRSIEQVMERPGRWSGECVEVQRGPSGKARGNGKSPPIHHALSSVKPDWGLVLQTQAAAFCTVRLQREAPYMVPIECLLSSVRFSSKLHHNRSPNKWNRLHGTLTL